MTHIQHIADQVYQGIQNNEQEMKRAIMSGEWTARDEAESICQLDQYEGAFDMDELEAAIQQQFDHFIKDWSEEQPNKVQSISEIPSFTIEIAELKNLDNSFQFHNIDCNYFADEDQDSPVMFVYDSDSNIMKLSFNVAPFTTVLSDFTDIEILDVYNNRALIGSCN